MKKLVLLAAACLLAGAPVYAQAQAQDQWSAPVRMVNSSSKSPVAPVHITMLPDGRVLVSGKDKSLGTHVGIPFSAVFTPTPLGQALPAQISLSNLPVPYEIPYPGAQPPTNDGYWVYDTNFCMATTLTKEGVVFAAGGSRAVMRFPPGSQTFDQYFLAGLDHSMIFNPPNSTWYRLPGKFAGTGGTSSKYRWYPTLTSLGGSGKMLIVAGSEYLDFLGGPDWPVWYFNRSVETYDAASGYQLVTSHNDAPAEIEAWDYPSAFQLPDGRVLMAGDDSRPVYLNLATKLWTKSVVRRPGAAEGERTNHGASHVLLPFRATDGEWGYSNGSTLTVGGEHHTTAEMSADLYDPATDAFTRYNLLGYRRHHPSTVVLPTGRILIVAGHNDHDGMGTGLGLYFDPVSRTITQGTAVMPEVRGYHTVTVLLPDGRVLVGGGYDAGGYSGEFAAWEKEDFRYYSPDYMGKPRPAITATQYTASTPINPGQSFWLRWSGDTSAAKREAVLIRLGSQTHSLDMSQRYVQLPVLSHETSGGTITTTVQVPANTNIVPPGHYMLFMVVDDVPSVARIVRINEVS